MSEELKLSLLVGVGVLIISLLLGWVAGVVLAAVIIILLIRS